MTEKGIQEIIDLYNEPATRALIASQRIGTNVDYTLVWDDIDFTRHGEALHYKFYFIKTDKGKTIGAVLDMKGDLHWYISPRYRKKGYLYHAMYLFILPHLAKIRPKQRITINEDEIGKDNFDASLSTAKKLGFKFQSTNGGKIEGNLGLGKFKKITLMTANYGMTFDQMADLKKRMKIIVGNLNYIQAKVEMSLGKSRYTHELAAMMKVLENYRAIKLDDALYDFNERK